MAGESFVTWTLSPVTTAAEVRRLTGYTEQRDCPDTDLELLIARAQVFATHELSERIHEVAMWGTVDGVNTRFELPPRFHGRVLLDADLSGDEKNDVQVFIKSRSFTGSPSTYTAATISSTDALHGQVVLSAAPDAQTTEKILFTGLLVLAAVTRERFKGCVELYSAHLLEQRVRGPGKVVLSNPKAEGSPSMERMSRGKWLDIYEREVGRLRRAGSKAASVKTRMPGSPDSWWADVGRHTVP